MEAKKGDIPMEKIVELLRRADDDGSFYDSLYKLSFYIEIAKGVDNIKNGKGVTLEEFDEEMEELNARYSRRFG